MSFRLVALTGPQQGMIFPMSGDEITIGRDPSNPLCITDPSSSRKHCSISLTAEGFRLKDLDSKNGTFVNGIPVRERLLQHGDRLQVGDSAFVFLTHSDEPMLQQENQSQIG